MRISDWRSDVCSSDLRHDRLDPANSLPATPDVFPGLGRNISAGAEVHFGWIGLRKMIGIEPRRLDRSAKIVSMHAGEQVRVDDVGERVSNDWLIVWQVRIGYTGNAWCRERGDRRG